MSGDIFTKVQKSGLFAAQRPSLSDAAVCGRRLAAPPPELVPDGDEVSVEEGQHCQDFEAPCDWGSHSLVPSACRTTNQ